tara:strand:+ start:12747 stop:14114 length:1368 start_codon:yes stop_codon:yes gene_type:complete
MADRFDSLESMCELIVDCPHSTPKWTDEGVIVLRNQNIRNGVLELSSPSYTNEEDYQKRIKRAVPQAGDIVFTREAPMGEVCLIPDGLKCCLGQRQVLLRPKKGISGEYLFWALQSSHVQHQISWNEGTGTTVSNVRIPVLKALQIPRHPADEAEAAKHLTVLANRIELNRQYYQTLEQMVQTLFKSWFVDFDPVIDNALAAGINVSDFAEVLKQKAEQRKQAQQLPDFKVLPDDIRALFSSEFEQSELGWIPKGWDVKPANEIANIAIGKTPPRKQQEWFSSQREGNVVWVSIRDMGAEATFIGDSSEYLTPESISKFNVKVVPQDSVILSFKLTLGRVCITSCELATNEAIAHFVSPKFGLTKEYVYSYLKTFNYDLLGSTSSIATAVNSKIIKEMPFLVPPASIIKEYNKIIEKVFDKKQKISEQNKNLEKMRDTLLPKLISGEITINKEVA